MSFLTVIDIHQSRAASPRARFRLLLRLWPKNWQQQWTVAAGDGGGGGAVWAHWCTLRGKTPAPMSIFASSRVANFSVANVCPPPTTAWQWPKWSAGALSSVSARLSTRRLPTRCHDALANSFPPHRLRFSVNDLRSDITVLIEVCGYHRHPRACVDLLNAYD